MRKTVLSFVALAIFSAAVVLTLTIAQATEPRRPASSPPTLGGCPVYPANNIWNVPVDTLPLDSRSNEYVNAMGATSVAHADFGSGLYQDAPIGIPFSVVPGTQLFVTINFTEFHWSADESDPGPYPIPPDAAIEGGNDPSNTGDRHVLVLDQGNCRLYELYYAWPQPGGSWSAGSGAVFTLTVNAPLRPDTWTSADAAGLPILPGLVRYDEVAASEINHALRFTSYSTRPEYIWPARHQAQYHFTSSSPPMGQRFRLKASFAIDNRFSAQTQVILRALKKYGMILADNGSSWFISGAPDAGWDNDALHQLDTYVKGSDFEAVDESSLMLDYNSDQVRTFDRWVYMPLVLR